MSAATRRGNGLDGTTVLMLVGVIGVIAVVGSTWLAVAAGSGIDRVNEGRTSDPFEVFFNLVRGRIVWPPSATWILIVILVVLAASAVTVAVMAARVRRRRTVVDAAAAHMGRSGQLSALSAVGARRTAERLGVQGWAGVFLGVTVSGRKRLYASPEDTITLIAGPRVGKTTAYVIPSIADAPGAVLTTSNKRDVLDTTRQLRAGKGQVWAFDPQAVAGEQATWWWNPLTYVTDDSKAAKLAAHFASSSRTPGSRGDAYFDSAGQDLLAGFLLAAALDDHPITTVFTWTTTPGDDEAVRVLRRYGYAQMADSVSGQVNGESRRRDSVYGTAAQMASCLRVRSIAQWITPQHANDVRPQFDPHAFVRSTDTLYSLSREGQGTAGPLVTALTAATVEAAEEYAATQRNGRLPVPLLGVLDEAANVCRWHDLPDLYSHYGSRGIVLLTILQSWSQGVQVWGRDGMRKLWSASNVAIYGGGVKEPEFLSELSQMIGDFDRPTTSTNVGRGSRSTAHGLHRERTLDVADLGALPRGRAVVLASGAPATLVRTVPWAHSPVTSTTKLRSPMLDASPMVSEPDDTEAS